MRLEIGFALLVGFNLGIVLMNIPPVLSELMRVYGISYTEISILMSAILWSHAAMQLPAGMIADRLGVRATQGMSLAIVSQPGVVLGLALLTAWFAAINFGALFHLASRTASVASLGTLLGFVNSLGNLGAVLFTLLFGWSKDALGSFSWGFAVLAVLAASALLPGARVLSRVERKEAGSR